MKDRSAGKIDAYGNTLMRGGDDNQPTTILTAQAQTVKKPIVEEEANIKKDELQPKGGDQKLDYAELEEWWYNTDIKKVKKAAQGMNLTGATLKDFINAFDKAKEFTTLQRFIERIKDCY